MYSKAGTQAAPFPTTTTSVYSTTVKWAPVRLAKAEALSAMVEAGDRTRLMLFGTSGVLVSGLLSSITWSRASTSVGQWPTAGRRHSMACNGPTVACSRWWLCVHSANHERVRLGLIQFAPEPSSIYLCNTQLVSPPAREDHQSSYRCCFCHVFQSDLHYSLRFYLSP